MADLEPEEWILGPFLIDEIIYQSDEPMAQLQLRAASWPSRYAVLCTSGIAERVKYARETDQVLCIVCILCWKF